MALVKKRLTNRQKNAAALSGAAHLGGKGWQVSFSCHPKSL
jgi:hypothetical protein